MPKFLVVNPDAEIGQVLEKVNKLQDKGFDAVLFLGDVSEKPPVDIKANVYFAGKEEKVCDIAENYTCLGRYGVYKLFDGTKVGFITGDEEFLKENSAAILEKFEVFKNDVDILISTQWPTTFSKQEGLLNGNEIVDSVVCLTQPKYHFAQGKFHENFPIEWESTGRFTRFISLNDFSSKEKWIYAFQMSESTPDNVVGNPFQLKRRREHEHMESKRAKIAPQSCFFCLGNADVKQHMLLSISDHAYMTIAKGPLTMPNDKMPFSGHALILPIEHVARNVNPQSANDILRYQLGLVKMFSKFNMATVMFSIHSKKTVHFHIQAMPVHIELIDRFQEQLEKQASHHNKRRNNAQLEFTTYKPGEYVEDENIDYIKFEVIKSIQDQTVYISKIPTKGKLDLQFGRRVVAYMLETPSRVKWDSVVQSEVQEKKEVEKFCAAFKEYDFTI